MLLSTLKRGTALTVSTVLLAGIAANANPVAPRAAARPTASTVSPQATAANSEQVLIEGGTLAANYLGNLMDIVGSPIACPSLGFPGRDCASESSLPQTPKTNPQYLYAAIGTGGAQLDFVNQHSGLAIKTASTYPEFADSLDQYSNVSPIGYQFPWAGTAKSTVEEDSLHAAAGDAPLPLGPSEGTQFTGAGFSYYSDSLAAYNDYNYGGTPGNDTSGGGFNANRGPAIVTPIIGTGVSIIFNPTGLTVPSGGLNLTQDDVCGIFTGTITDWSNVSANSGGSLTGTPSGSTSNPITIVHRFDGSGTSFLTSYDLSMMCSPNNPKSQTGKPVPAHYWNQQGFTQGVGTDSKVLSGGVVPVDTSAPEVVWPATSVGASKSSGMIDAVAYGLGDSNGNACTAPNTPPSGDSTCTNPMGYIGYVTPSNTLPSTIDEAYVENYAGNYEQANATTVGASLAGTTSGDTNPPGYPKDNAKNTLYFPYPTATTGDALVGYSYGYFYTCTPKVEADQYTAVKNLFAYEESKTTSATAAAVAMFWNLNGLGTAQLKNLTSEIGLTKDAAVTKPTTYISPVDGSTQKYTCTDTNT